MSKVKWTQPKNISKPMSKPKVKWTVSKKSSKTNRQPKSSSQSKSSSLSKQLLEHQKRVVTYMLNHRGALVYHGMGSGKTRIAVILVALLKIPSIVVLPAALRENFRKEIRAAKVHESLFEIMSSQAFLENPVDCADKLLIVDEAHLLRNAEGKISKKVSECAQQAKKVLLLTGTPLVNRPSDIAPLLNMIVKDKIQIQIGPVWNRKTFRDIPTGEAFVRVFGPDGLNDVGKQLWSELFPCMFSYYLPPKSPDFPTMKIIDVKVPMSAFQAEVYKAWETKSLTPSMVKMLANPNTELDVTKLPQFRAYLDGGRRICNVVGDEQNTSAPKFENMMDTLSKTSGKALVFSHYLAKGIDVAAQMLRNRNISFNVFTGRETPNQKKESVEAYNKDKIRVFLLSSAGGIGLDLHDTETVHIMDPAWNEADVFQAIYRAVRYKSHTDPNAVVKVYRYYAYKSYNSPTLSADMYLLKVSQMKDQINKRFLEYAIGHSMETQGVGSCTIDTL